MKSSVHKEPKTYQNTIESMQQAHFDIIDHLLDLYWSLEVASAKGKERAFRYGNMLDSMIVDYHRTNPDVQKLHEILEKYEELKQEFDLAKKSGLLNRRSEDVQPAA